ncbi:MAG: TrmH family RNA methyltransferase [Candidatus Paceibacteria bacterium]
MHQKKFREKYGEYLVEGEKGVMEAISGSSEVIMLVIEEKMEKDYEKMLNLAKNKGISVGKSDKKQAQKIKTTETFPGVLAIVKAEKRSVSDLENGKPVICLDRISDPGNLGTIIRTANWFGINNILISEGSVEARNEKVVRSSMGSFFHVDIVETNDVKKDLKKLKEGGYKLFGLDLKGRKISNTEKLDKKAVYIFGNESHGLADEIENMLDARYTIEGSGEAESLNIGVSAGIVFFNMQS